MEGFTTELAFAVFHLTADFYVDFLLPLSPYFIQVHQIEPRTIAMMVSVITLVSALGQIFFAFSVPRLKNQWLFTYLTMACLVLPTAFFRFNETLPAIFGVFGLIFLANAAFHPLGAEMASRNSTSSGMASFMSGGIVGAALGPIFITWFVSQIGLARLIYVNLLFWAVLNLFLIPLRNNHPPAHLAQSFSWTLIPILGPIWIMVGLRTFFLFSLHAYTPIHAGMLGFSLMVGGSLLSLGIIAALGSNLIGARLHIVFGNWIPNLVSFTGMGIFTLLFIQTERLLPFLVLYTLADAFGFLTLSSNVAEAQKLLPHHRVFATSVAMGLSWATGYLIHLVFAAFFGNQVQLVLYSVGGLSLVTALILLIFQRFFCPLTKPVEVSPASP